MLIDVTGIELTPGNCGNDCLGNGEHFDDRGNPIECCCDECDYMLCCLPNFHPARCSICSVSDCPRKNEKKQREKTAESAIY